MSNGFSLRNLTFPVWNTGSGSRFHICDAEHVLMFMSCISGCAHAERLCEKPCGGCVRGAASGQEAQG